MKPLCILIIVLTTTAVSQQLVIKKNNEISTIQSAATDVIASSVDNTIMSKVSTDDDIRLIVELTTPTRLEQKISGRTFLKSIAVASREYVLAKIPDARMSRTFETVLSGFVITTKRSNVRTISTLPGVRSVYPDMIVTTLPESNLSSNPVVPTASTSLATGLDVRVGIIDTGIDYLHEAFGRGFGKGYRIAGGYDFVNNDNDPMDDNGHGTHVAGIIAGNSASISGAARNATLFAYKVLDNNGSGSSSAVIAAIEQAINDSIHVLNLSLGSSSGSIDDPLSRAVDRAAAAGIVVVVAAGNNGGFSTINSPGMARLAMTVGATDARAIASFSSKGPETNQYQIKPEIVAPGVNVLSAKNGGGYVQMSGTSMAAPFVTAIAAAMREIHPDWTAEQIRDAVISSSKDLGISIFSQGHGKISASALETKVFTSPAQISFGFNPPSVPVWRQQRKVTVFNKSSEVSTFRFVLKQQHPAVLIRFTPEHVEIESGDSAVISIDLETNNQYLINNNAFENGYVGTIIAAGNVDSLIIPYTFFKGPVLQLRFNEIPWMVLIHNGSNYSKTVTPKSTSLALILRDGEYDVVASFYGSRYVVAEGVDVRGKADVEISSEQAVNPLSFRPIDQNGAPLVLGALKGTYSYLETFVHKATGFAIIGMGGGKTTAHTNQPKYFSPVSDRYTYGFSMTLQPNNATSYTFDIIADSGISQARDILFQPSDIQSIDVKYSLNQSVQRAFPIVWTTYVGGSSSMGVTFYDGNAEPMTFPFIQKSYYTRRTTQFPIFHQREAYSF